MLGFPSGSTNGDRGRCAGKIGSWGFGGKVGITCYQVNNPSIAFPNITIVVWDASSQVNNRCIYFPDVSIVDSRQRGVTLVFGVDL